MRAVLDTNVVASALLWGGAPKLLLQAGREQRLVLLTSPALLAELAGILGRPKFSAKIAASGLTVDELVARYATLTTVVRPQPTPRIAPDPDDDVVIGTALAGHAEVIVTGDKPLLSVGSHQGVRLVTVQSALALLQNR
jgi:uncharacterized protein